MRRMVDAFASYERALIRCRTRAALAAKRAKGLRTNSTAPYGWRFEGDRLEPDAAEQQLWARLLELAQPGRSMRQLAKALTAEGYVPRGRRWHRWHPNSFRRILRASRGDGDRDPPAVLVRRHLPGFLARPEEDGHGLPEFIKKELWGFAGCGDFELGFVRTHAALTAVVLDQREPLLRHPRPPHDVEHVERLLG